MWNPYNSVVIKSNSVSIIKPFRPMVLRIKKSVINYTPVQGGPELLKITHFFNETIKVGRNLKGG